MAPEESFRRIFNSVLRFPMLDDSSISNVRNFDIHIREWNENHSLNVKFILMRVIWKLLNNDA